MNPYPKPFDPVDFPAIAPWVSPEPRDNSKLIAYASVESRNALKPPSDLIAIATELWIGSTVDPSKRSASFQNQTMNTNPLPNASHFNFLPSMDDVEIRFTVFNPQNATAARFELWSAVITTGPIWFKDYAGAAAQELLSGKNLPYPSIPWSDVVIAGDLVKFPHQCPNVAHGPYQLRLLVTSDRGAKTTAWTYFDVVVGRIELHYGPQALIPTAAINDVKTVHYWPLTQADEQQLVQDLQRSGSAVPSTGLTKVVLKSTQAAYVHFQEWYTWKDMAYLRHKARWGDGPRIPLIAKIFLLDVVGAEQHSAKAAESLGPAKFLWDWHDKTEIERNQDIDAVTDPLTPTAAFVKAALKYKENAAGEPPDCLNCHADRGGKRGGAAKIFPAQASLAAFPFLVDAAPTRLWASFSQARLDGPYACCTGVIFQPSRMALDSYKVYVALATLRQPDRATPTLDVTGKIGPLLADHPGLPTANSGMFEVRRRIDARYVRKSASTPSMDLGYIESMFHPGGVQIEWRTEYWNAATYRNLFAAAGNSDESNIDAAYIRDRRHPKNRAGRKNKITTYRATRSDKPFLDFDHWSGDLNPSKNAIANESQLSLPARDRVFAHFLRPVAIKYISKKRIYNDKKRKFAKIQAKYPLASPDEQYYRFYQEALTDDERTKLDVDVKVAWVADKWAGWDVDWADGRQWAADNYFYGYGFGEFFQELHQREVMANGFLGMTFFHYTHMYEAYSFDPTVPPVRQCDLGGLAAVGMSADLGFKAGFAVWDHPNNMQRQNLVHDKLRRQKAYKPADLLKSSALFMNGNATSAHEFGHFMHLSHHIPTAESTAESDVHDQGDVKCLMNYDHDGLHLCGGCALRTRGWAFFQDAGVLGFNNANPANAGAAPAAPKVELNLTVAFANTFATF